MRQWARVRAAPMVCAVTAAVVWAGAAGAQVVDPNLWGVDNRVLTLARSGNTLYVGGAFRSVGPQTGGGVPLGLRDGVALETYPRVAGEVKTVVPDGSGGWYIGGSFVGVGGLPRANLAHVLPDGSVSAWSPNPSGSIRTLVVDGSTLYAGGDFDEIGGRPQEGVAAFDLGTGDLSAWAPRIGKWYVERYVAAILVHGNTVYVGGAFSSIGGEARTCLAAVDAVTGHVLPWNPVAYGQVACLAEHANVLFVGGYFVQMAGRNQRYLASFDLRSGQLTAGQIAVVRDPEDCECDGGPYVGVLTVHGDQLYVGGSFTLIGGQRRGGLASVDLHSGDVSAWDPQLVFPYWPSPYCHAVVVRGSTVYVGGNFSGIGGRSQAYVGAVNARSGEPTDWAPLPNGQVDALALSGETIYAGGWFTSIGPLVRRTGLAAFDLGTGKVLPWDPEPNELVQSLLVSGNTVYVAGDFSVVGGKPRAHLAALDGTTGQATAWNPGVNGAVWGIALGNGVLYAGGSFSSGGGLSRRNLAAFDTLTGAATPWDPHANDQVYTVAVGHNSVFACGWFTRVGGQTHWTLAALDPVTGSSRPWDVNCDGIVVTLLASDTTLYAGGFFDHLGGAQRENVAAVSTTTGLATQWNPDVEVPPTLARVQALAMDANAVYIGGEFATVGGVDRTNLAAVNRVTGGLLPWNPAPDPDGLVWALAGDGSVVYAGGGFSRMGLSAANGLAAISPALSVKGRAFPAELVAGRQPILTSSVQPNPIRAEGVIRFGLPVAATVSLAVYDIQGRSMADLLHGQREDAGQHEVAVRVDSWPPGCYMYRLQAGPVVLTRTMIVVR